MKKMKMGIFLLMCASLLLGGCQQTEEIKTGQATESKAKMQIGISFDSFVIERWTRDRDVFVSTAENLGAEVNVQNANGDVDEQVSQINYFIDKGMDVIVVVAVDCNKLEAEMTKAKARGIKTICYDRLIQNANADMYISFDNEEVGRLMAENLVANLPENSNIFMIQGPKTDNNVALVKKGFDEVIEKSSLQVAYSANCEGWLAEDAFTYANEGLLKDRNVAGIMCGNDDLASQVFRSLSQNRLAGKVIMVGQDGELSACQRIVEGTQSMTVYKSVEQLAKTSAEYAVKLGKGEAINTEKTINDGSYEIPFVVLTPTAVTKDNMDEVIVDGGFHMREDVYMNVQK